MKSELIKEILVFRFSLIRIKQQAIKVENKLVKYSREWAQVASFKTKCEETQSVLIKSVDKFLREKNEKERDSNFT